MKKFLMPTIAFFVTFALVFSLFAGVFGRVTYLFAPSPDVEAEDVVGEFGIPDEWLARYNITLENFVDVKKDIDHDGLSLLEEYEYHTDPNNPDTDGDNYADGTEVNNGYSPSGPGLMDTNNNDISDKWEKDMIGALVSDKYDDSDKDGLGLYDEYLYGTNPRKADTDGDGYNDGVEVHNGYDPTVSGEARPKVTLTIDKIELNVPVVLSKDTSEESLQKDLNNGVIHYPHTAMPGQRGNIYIAGHSSNYVWSKGAYNYAFRDLGDLEIGDIIIAKVRMGNGKEFEYKYTVTIKEIVAPDDSRIFADTQSQILTLTTCWPLGTNAKRLMVKAELQE